MISSTNRTIAACKVVSNAQISRTLEAPGRMSVAVDAQLPGMMLASES